MIHESLRASQLVHHSEELVLGLLFFILFQAFTFASHLLLEVVLLVFYLSHPVLDSHDFVLPLKFILTASASRLFFFMSHLLKQDSTIDIECSSRHVIRT